MFIGSIAEKLADVLRYGVHAATWASKPVSKAGKSFKANNFGG